MEHRRHGARGEIGARSRVRTARRSTWNVRLRPTELVKHQRNIGPPPLPLAGSVRRPCVAARPRTSRALTGRAPRRGMSTREIARTQGDVPRGTSGLHRYTQPVDSPGDDALRADAGRDRRRARVSPCRRRGGGMGAKALTACARRRIRARRSWRQTFHRDDTGSSMRAYGAGFTLCSWRGIDANHSNPWPKSARPGRPPATVGLLAGLDAESDVTVTHTTAEPPEETTAAAVPDAMMPALPRSSSRSCSRSRIRRAGSARPRRP